MNPTITWPRWRYLLLALALAPITLIHHFELNAAFEQLRGRPLILLPTEALILKELGKLAGLLSLSLIAVWLLSAKYRLFRSDVTALRITTGTLVFAFLYGIWASIVLFTTLEFRL